jgi:transposase
VVAYLMSPEPPPQPPKQERRGQVLEVLRELLAQGLMEEALALVAKLVARNTELEKRLAELMWRGRKNEGVSSAQLLLLLEGLNEAPDERRQEADTKLREASGIDEKGSPPAKPEKPKKQPSLRRPLPPDLRRVDNPIAVPPAQRPCPTCGTERTCIGHDVTEVLELIPAEVIVRVDKREKLACTRCEGELVRAPLGDKVVEGGKMGTTLVAQVLVDKYRDGLPLHRQKERFERLGVDLPVSTLADQVQWATDLLQPVWRAAQEAVLGARIMHLDGTGLAVLDDSKAKGVKLGTLWGYVGDEQTALYLYTSTGKKQGQVEGEQGPEDFLAKRRGYVVADASNLFDQSFQSGTLIECGCNMHARRYFVKALDSGDTRASLPLAAFKKLYEVEELAREAGPEHRLIARQEKSKPVYEELIAWCKTHQPYELPSSAMGRAIKYLLNHQIALQRFLQDGVIPIDNGIVERLHVRTAMTRKNYLFAGSDTGAQRAAIAYTVLGSCQLAKVNPVQYLADVLPRLARGIRLADVAELLPARWKAARSTAPPA